MPAAVRGRPVTLTREGPVFRLAFTFNRTLVARAKELPYATFDGASKSWTTAVCTQTVQQLRRWWHEGLLDIGPDDLLYDLEEVPEAREAVLRSGTTKRPYYVHFATRSSAQFPAFRALPGALWEKKAGSLSYPPSAAPALADMVDRGLLEDPEDLLRTAEVTVSFDARTGQFAVRGNAQAAAAFHTGFPGTDVVATWKERNLDVDFLDAYTQEMYRGELARAGDGIQPDGLKIELMPYQKKAVALALERTGIGVYLEPGLGKCLHPRTPVWANGDAVPIGELWDAHAGATVWDGDGEWASIDGTILVHAVDAARTTITVPATRLYRQKVRETLRRITLEDGSTATITAAHRLLTEHGGWSTDFAVGDRVAIPSSVRWSGEPFDLDVVKFLAWQIGEGNEQRSPNSKYTVTITQSDRAVLEDLRATWCRIADRYGFLPGRATISQYKGAAAALRCNSKAWRELLESWGYTWGHTSAAKTVPGPVMRGDAGVAREFLRHYYAAEGHVGAARSLELVSASEHLMRQVSYLLRRFGVRMTLAKRMKSATNGANIKRPYWVGTVTGLSLHRFAGQIGIADPRKQSALDDVVRTAARTSVETYDVYPLLAEARSLANGISGYALVAHGRPGCELSSALRPGRRLTRERVLECAAGMRSTLSGDTLASYRARHAELTARGGKGSTSPKLRRVIDQLASFAADDEARGAFGNIIDQLEETAHADLWWARVVAVEEVAYDGYVYDLEVAGPHNFVAGGVYCHNTAIAIAAGWEMLARDQISRVVAVVPAAVRTQWAREITKFTPTDPTDIVVVRGDRGDRADAYEAARNARWLVVHYDILARDEEDLKDLFDGALVVADEAHRVKNFRASRTEALLALAKGSRRRMALTGTPVETHPGEWYQVLSGFASPGCLGSAFEFNERYRWKARFGGYEGRRNTGELRERSRPFYIRFTKAQVATHLPPLRVTTTTLDPSPAYEGMLRRAHADAADEIRNAVLARKGATVPTKAAKPKNGSKQGTGSGSGDFELLDQELFDEVSDGADMTAIGQLRLLCSSPRLINADSEAGRALLDAGLVLDEDGPKVDEVRTITAELLASQQRRHADLDDAGRDRASATAEEVTGERIVLFTFSKRMANLLAERMTEDGVPYVLFTGDTSSDDRDAAVAAFIDPASDVIAFIATDAAAEGLNLGACCSTLVNVDLPWTPARLAQRSQRIHRLDGTAPRYQVTNLIVSGTMEHGLLRLLEKRTDLADELLGEAGGRASTVGRRVNHKRTTRRGPSLVEAALNEYTIAHPAAPRRRTATATGRAAAAAAIGGRDAGTPAEPAGPETGPDNSQQLTLL